MTDDLLALKNFCGKARLFPLPNLVVFPFVVQGLHIFEPRYRQMATDALAHDRLIAMALLSPGWELDYQGTPPLYPVVCLGRIIADERLADGRYNLQLRGLSRARILKEIPGEEPYRSAHLELLSEARVSDPTIEQRLRGQLRQAVPAWCPEQEPAATAFRNLLSGDLALGILCDILGYALPLTIAAKQEILESTDVDDRVHTLLRHLQSQAPKQAAPVTKFKFPPDFSLN